MIAGVWRRLPVIVRCSLTGLALAVAGTVPWAALLPFYLAVAATYGALAYLTDSILPGVVLTRVETSSPHSTCTHRVAPNGIRCRPRSRWSGTRAPMRGSGPRWLPS